MSGAAGLFDGDLYAANTRHHRAHDEDALAGLPLAPGTDVLDLGCGSGDFTARLVPLVAPGRVVGVDVSPSQVAHARAHHPGAQFLAGRAQDVGTLFPPASFDVVVTVATLHWVPAGGQPDVLAGAARVLRPGGVCAPTSAAPVRSRPPARCSTRSRGDTAGRHPRGASRTPPRTPSCCGRRV